MRRVLTLAVVGFAALSLSARPRPSVDESADLAGWSHDFSAEKADLTHTGKNPYFVLEPGYQLEFKSKDERVVKTVLNETKVVDGVECRVIEEKEWKDGKLVEVSLNYFAISKRTNAVYYFGEDVDEYKDDKVVGHPGSWLAGVKGTRFGLMIPGLPLAHAKYYHEVAPGQAMDRSEIVGVGLTVSTPAGEFKNCFRTEETTPLEKGKSYKEYAPGVGGVTDGDVKLVKYGKVELPKK
jgi:hypothetical protein